MTKESAKQELAERSARTNVNYLYSHMMPQNRRAFNIQLAYEKALKSFLERIEDCAKVYVNFSYSQYMEKNHPIDKDMFNERRELALIILS